MNQRIEIHLDDKQMGQRQRPPVDEKQIQQWSVRLGSICLSCYLPFILTAVVLIVVISSVAWACPFCKDALFDVSQARQGWYTAQGYAWSIGLLLGVPIGLVGTVAVLIVRARRRARRRGLP